VRAAHYSEQDKNCKPKFYKNECCLKIPGAGPIYSILSFPRRREICLIKALDHRLRRDDEYIGVSPSESILLCALRKARKMRAFFLLPHQP
jgi:hypothetical protein